MALIDGSQYNPDDAVGARLYAQTSFEVSKLLQDILAADH